MTAKVIPFTSPTKCQPGTVARHPVYGLCDVIKASGAMRTVLYETREPDPMPDLTDGASANDEMDDLLFSETVTICEAEVDVNQLRELDLDRDLMKQPMSRVLGLNRTWR